MAEDLSLDRKVALKFLPDVFTGDPERMTRFERKAKLLASLNHPNIASIYGLEESDGTHFLVMELVEGVTLEDYLAGNAGVPAGFYFNTSETLALPAALPELVKIHKIIQTFRQDSEIFIEGNDDLVSGFFAVH